MADVSCEKADCTVAETGRCLLSLDPCPHYRGALAPVAPDPLPQPQNGPTDQTQGDVITTRSRGRLFHSGLELGTVDALDVMRARYTHLIGVLGPYGAGKTCILSSLYLLASSGTLPSAYRFAGSLTLKGFEDRARRIREWSDGQLFDQLADHTVLTDPRQPGLLHLAIREANGDRHRYELLLTDLPGEWTENLVKRAAGAERLQFLQRADGIILVVDGPAIESEAKHVELQRMRNLIDRLAGDVGMSRSTPIVVLVSKCDETEMRMPAAAEELRVHATGLGFSVEVILSAAFSRKPKAVPNGTGVFEAIEAILKGSHASVERAHATATDRQRLRTFLKFKHGAL